MDLQQQKQRVLEQKRQRPAFNNLTETYLENSMNESVGELSGYDNHPADLAVKCLSGVKTWRQG